MILKRLSIVNYKNIVQAETVFSPKINCFFGNNGMGKTNLSSSSGIKRNMISCPNI